MGEGGEREPAPQARGGLVRLNRQARQHCGSQSEKGLKTKCSEGLNVAD